MAMDPSFYSAAERRIEYWTIAIGAAAAASAAIFWSASAGGGVAIGAVFSWINFRWMRRGIETLARVSIAQQAAEKPQVPRRVYFQMIGRYALLILVAYVILRGFGSMVDGFLCGLFAAVAAVLLKGVSLLVRRRAVSRA